MLTYELFKSGIATRQMPWLHLLAESRPQGYKTFFMLRFQHEILNAHKDKKKKIKKFVFLGSE